MLFHHPRPNGGDRPLPLFLFYFYFFHNLNFIIFEIEKNDIWQEYYENIQQMR
jgi:hypothetical protein